LRWSAAHKRILNIKLKTHVLAHANAKHIHYIHYFHYCPPRKNSFESSATRPYKSFNIILYRCSVIFRACSPHITFLYNIVFFFFICYNLYIYNSIGNQFTISKIDGYSNNIDIIIYATTARVVTHCGNTAEHALFSIYV